MKILLLPLMLILAACASQSPPPTSERLEAIRTEKESTIIAELNAANLSLGAPLFIRIFKEEAILETWLYAEDTKRFEPFKSYDICNFSGTLGPKLREGDYQAPEGFYNVTADQMNPWSRYQLSFNLGFPNAYDRAHKRTGTHLMVHGGCTSVGCYAVGDPSIEEIYLLADASLKGGQREIPVHAFPFRMTPRNMDRHAGSGWKFFWENLKQGYDAFETTKIPPQPRHENYKYVFKTPDSQIALY